MTQKHIGPTDPDPQRCSEVRQPKPCVKYGLLCTAVQYSLLEAPQHPPPPPRICAYIRGRHWSAKIDDISL